MRSQSCGLTKAKKSRKVARAHDMFEFAMGAAVLYMHTFYTCIFGLKCKKLIIYRGEKSHIRYRYSKYIPEYVCGFVIQFSTRWQMETAPRLIFYDAPSENSGENQISEACLRVQMHGLITL